jgi:hypothetical protein
MSAFFRPDRLTLFAALAPRFFGAMFWKATLLKCVGGRVHLPFELYMYIRTLSEKHPSIFEHRQLIQQLVVPRATGTAHAQHSCRGTEMSFAFTVSNTCRVLGNGPTK